MGIRRGDILWVKERLDKCLVRQLGIMMGGSEDE